MARMMQTCDEVVSLLLGSTDEKEQIYQARASVKVTRRRGNIMTGPGSERNMGAKADRQLRPDDLNLLISISPSKIFRCYISQDQPEWSCEQEFGGYSVWVHISHIAPFLSGRTSLCQFLLLFDVWYINFMAHSYHTNYFLHYPCHPGPSTTPLALAGQTASLRSQSGVQMLCQDLATAQSKLSEYTTLISNLYAELETIRGVVCHNCKAKISPESLSHKGSPSAESYNIGIQQATSDSPPHMTSGIADSFPFSVPNALNVQEGMPLPPTHPASPIPSQSRIIPNISNVSTASEPSETSPPPPTKDAAITAQRNAEKLQPRRRSVTYNSKTEKMLNITFVHAFEHAYPVNAVRFSSDGNSLAAGLNHILGRTQIYDVNTRLMKCALAENPDKANDKISRHTWSVCFSVDARYVVVGPSDGTIYVWEISMKRVRASFRGHQKDVRSLDVSPNGRFLATCSYDRSVRIWNLRDGSSRILSTEGKRFTSVRFSPNGYYVAASNTDGFLRIWNIRSGKLVGKWNHGESIRSMAFSPNGKVLVSGGIVGTIKSWDISSLDVSGRSLDFSAKKCRGEVGILEKLKFEGHAGEVRSSAVSPDGRWVVTGSSDKRVRIWDMHTAVQQCILEGHADELWAVDFSPNYIATGSKDGDVTLWRYKTV